MSIENKNKNKNDIEIDMNHDINMQINLDNNNNKNEEEINKQINTSALDDINPNEEEEEDILQKIQKQINFLNNKFEVTNTVLTEEKENKAMNFGANFHKENYDKEKPNSEIMENLKNEK